ncbi:6797_t:CDS:2 [Ambispora gerdemannii]|uniref:6797_t:CDS:1 n=1 Tax=Ambispora gerdemannii TaxID=144530 RepID=A0A9N9BY12_9GLOM|nr:6797_t:CDS:2 [Ambispora gerdemannii]
MAFDKNEKVFRPAICLSVDSSISRTASNVNIRCRLCKYEKFPLLRLFLYTRLGEPYKINQKRVLSYNSHALNGLLKSATTVTNKFAVPHLIRSDSIDRKTLYTRTREANSLDKTYENVPQYRQKAVNMGFEPVIRIEGRTANEIWDDYSKLTVKQIRGLQVEPDFNAMLSVFKRELIKPGVGLMMKQIFNDIVDKAGQKPSMNCFNIMLSAYKDLRDLAGCKACYQKMQEFDVSANRVTYNVMIAAHVKLGNPMDGIKLYEQMVKKNIRREKTTYMVMIDAYLKARDSLGENVCIEKSMDIFRAIERDGLTYDDRAFNAIMNLRVKMNLNDENMDEVAELFREMKKRKIQPTTVTYSILINALVQAKRKDEAITLYKEMQRNDVPDNMQILKSLDISKLEMLGMMREKESSFSEKDYNELIAKAIKESNWIHAFEVFKTMRKKGVNPTITTYTILIEAYIRNSEIDQAMDIFNGMKLEGIQPDIYIFCSLIKGHLKVRRFGETLDLISLMEKDGVRGDTVTMNTLIKAAADFKEYNIAEGIYRRMQKNQISPDRVTYKILLWLAAQYRNDETLEELLTEMREKYKMEESGEIYQSIITGFSRAGKVYDAMRWYYDMKTKGLQPSRAIISHLIEVFSRRRDSQTTIRLWNEMLELKHKPDGLDVRNVIDVSGGRTAIPIAKQLEALSRGEQIERLQVADGIDLEDPQAFLLQLKKSLEFELSCDIESRQFDNKMNYMNNMNYNRYNNQQRNTY